MRAFAHLPSKRRVAGVIAFALAVVSVLGVVHHHNLGVRSSAPAFTTAHEGDTARTADCFVCRTLVSARELVPHVSAPYVVAEQSFDAPATNPVLADTFRPSAPRAPPAA